MATIEKRYDRNGRPRYRVRIRRLGAREISRTFHRLTDARAYEQQMEADIAAGRHVSNASSRAHTLQEAIDRYLGSSLFTTKAASTQRAHQQKLGWWADRLGHYRLSMITTAMIIEARDDLAATHAPNTVKGYMSALRYLFNLAKDEWEWIRETPIPKRLNIQPGEPRLRILSDDERNRLLDACERDGYPYMYIQVVLAIATGARQSEIVNLEWRQIDFRRRLVTFEKTKTRERRSVALTGLAFQAIADHYKNRSGAGASDWVFPRLRGEGEPAFNKASWWRVLESASIEDFRFHDLRHTAASYLAMHGASLLDIAQILGHKSVSMTQLYAHLTSNYTERIVEEMNQEIFQDRIEKPT